MAVYNIHGGHNPSGKIACGASDLLDESREDRKICKEVVKLLKKKGQKSGAQKKRALKRQQETESWQT